MQMIRSSKVAHQHVVEFLFLFGALIVALGFGFLLLLFFVRRGAFLLSGGGGAGALSVFGSSAAAKAESDVASVARVSMRTRAVFMKVSPLRFAIYEGIARWPCDVHHAKRERKAFIPSGG